MRLTIFSKIHRLWLKSETFVLVLLFLSLIVIAVAQIVMRNIFSSGIIWAESYVRVSVLWLAMIGAMIASRDGRHICIDAMVRKFPRSVQQVARRITALFTAIICLVITWYSLEFIVQEYQYGGIAFAFVPNWVCEAIIPFAFIVIAVRYLVVALRSVTHQAP